MTQPTVTLQELRRAICRELRMPFFRRVGSSAACDAGSTSTKIIDAALTQPDKYWNNSFLYWINTQTSCLINAFNSNTKELRLEKAVGANPVAGDTYEIHSIWNADEIHETINRAIKSSRQTFFSPTINETLAIREEIYQYDISGLTVIPWILNKVYMEIPKTDIQFEAASAGATSVTAPSDIDLSDVTSIYTVTISLGTGAGQVRTVTSVAGQQINVAAWTTTPDTTSRIHVFNGNESSWYPLHKFHTDALEYPQFMRITMVNPDFYGGRYRLEYLGVSSELTTEASTTIIPEEYLVNKACSLLHGQVLNGTKSDKESHYAEFKRYQEEADSYIVRNAPHAPGILIRDPDAHINSRSRDRSDPLNWQS